MSQTFRDKELSIFYLIFFLSYYCNLKISGKNDFKVSYNENSLKYVITVVSIKWNISRIFYNTSKHTLASTPIPNC